MELNIKCIFLIFLSFLIKSETFISKTKYINLSKPNNNKLWGRSKGKISESLNTNEIIPSSDNQKNYLKNMETYKNKLILGIGPAGTGKTFLAFNYAINELKKNNIEKIIITRPVLTADEELGFLPGNINKKMNPWTKPLFDILEEKYTDNEISKLLNSKKIEISPLAFMRGRTFKNSIVIADEMQNSTPNQMFMIATRIGDNSKLLITGDLNQSDRKEKNGLSDFINKINMYNENSEGIVICEFDNKDIKRSKIVEKIVDIYENFNRTKLPLPTNRQMKIRDIVIEKLDNFTREEKKRLNSDAAMIPKSEYNRLNPTYKKG